MQIQFIPNLWPLFLNSDSNLRATFAPCAKRIPRTDWEWSVRGRPAATDPWPPWQSQQVCERGIIDWLIVWLIDLEFPLLTCNACDWYLWWPSDRDIRQCDPVYPASWANRTSASPCSTWPGHPRDSQGRCCPRAACNAGAAPNSSHNNLEEHRGRHNV